MALAAALDDRDLVVARSKPISGAGDVVEDDRVGALALELRAGALDRLGAGLGGEADQRLVLAAAGEPEPARMSSVGSRLELEAAASLARDLAGSARRRRGSRRARRPSAARGSGELARDGARRARAVVSTSIRRDAGAARAATTLAAIRVTSAPRRAAAAARARPMRPLERLPMKRTGSIGSRVPPAVTRTRSPSQGRRAAGQQRPRSRPAGAGRRAAGRRRARRARRARPPRARSP